MRRSTTSSSRSSSSRTRSMKAGPFSARRQASVATRRARADIPRRHLVLADPERLERAVDRAVAQAVAVAEAFPEPDDARERVDDAKARMATARRRAGGNCWSRGRGPHRRCRGCGGSLGGAAAGRLAAQGEAAGTPDGEAGASSAFAIASSLIGHTHTPCGPADARASCCGESSNRVARPAKGGDWSITCR